MIIKKGLLSTKIELSVDEFLFLTIKGGDVGKAIFKKLIKLLK